MGSSPEDQTENSSGNNWFHNFFWWCAGVHIPELKKDEHRFDRSTYLSIGAAVFFTGVLASLSGGYWLHTVFQEETDNSWLIYSFGALYGTIILNIDRLTVMNMAKGETVIKTLFSAIPRLALASVIAIVIANPIELLLFKGEINTMLEEIADEARIESSKNSSTAQKILSHEKEFQRKQIVKKYNKLDEDISKQRELYNAEVTGNKAKGGSGEAGDGNKAKAIMRVLKDLETKIEGITQAYNGQEKIYLIKRDSLIKVNESYADSIYQELLSNAGILARNKALDRYIENDPKAKFIYYLVITLILLLEITPILAKLLSKSSTYENVVNQIFVESWIKGQETIRSKEKASIVDEIDKQIEIAKAKLAGFEKIKAEKPLKNLKDTQIKYIIDSENAFLVREAFELIRKVHLIKGKLDVEQDTKDRSIILNIMDMVERIKDENKKVSLLKYLMDKVKKLP